VCDSGGPYLYDLASDPTEFTNVAGDEEYREVLEYLEARLEFHAQQKALVDPDLEVSSSDGVDYLAVWKEAGGAVPWIETDQTKEDEGGGDEEDVAALPITSALPEAPNIVFILLDDVGLNDGPRLRADLRA